MRKTRSSGMSVKEIRQGIKDGFISVKDGVIGFHYDRHPGGFARVSLTHRYSMNDHVSRWERRLIMKEHRRYATNKTDS